MPAINAFRRDSGISKDFSVIIYSPEKERKMPRAENYNVNQGFDPGPENGIQMLDVDKKSDDKTGYNIDDHRIPLDELVKRYSTHEDKGLKTEQVEVNRQKFGANVLIPPEKPSMLVNFLKCIVGGLCALLWVCAILCFASYGAQYIYTDNISSDNLVLGISIVIVIFVSAFFEFYQQFKSDRIMESFKNMVPRNANVIRDGKKTPVPVVDLVAGDIVEVSYGDLIPADIRILECSDFKVDNSSLTGESEPMKRSPNCTDDNPMETKNLAFFSTNALEGYCKGMVVRAGGSTFIGRLASLTSVVDVIPSPMKKEMHSFVAIMTVRSIVFGVTFFIIAMLIGYSIIDAIFFVIGIVVANVPEGLTMTFTMVLAITAQRMAKKNCLVKNVQAVETLGSTSVICSDKTGTLTQNKMSVAHMWFNNEIAEADTHNYTRTGYSFNKEEFAFKALANVVSLCSKAAFNPEDAELPILKRRVNGDASETALLRCVEHYVGNVQKYRDERKKLGEIPFNSRNKYQVSIHEQNDPKDKRHLLVMKGAPERVIAYCTKILIGDKTHDLDDRWKNEFYNVYAMLGSYGERVLAFCDCYLPLEEYADGHIYDTEDPVFMNEGLRLVGLISLIDPPRPSVPDAVAKCRSAGVKVVMVTGDHQVTATAIARAVGIISPGNQTIEEMAIEQGCSVSDIDPKTVDAAVVSGEELKLLTSEQLRNVVSNHSEIVFARTSPEQKYMIVEAFQDLGHIVAVTGDGVNDSPALKKADIGVAMGIGGSEVSKETADMILMDDNFATIVTGIEEGRLIFDNIKKLICYNLADNIAEMYSVWIFIILACPLPMGTIAMLLSVCVTDPIPAISLAHEKAEADIMKLKPRNPMRDKLVTPQLLSYCYGQTSMIEVASGYFAYFVTMGLNGWMPWDLYQSGSNWENDVINDMTDSFGQEWAYSRRKALGYMAQTSFFASIVLTQVANVIICKTRRMSIFQKGMKNWYMNFAIPVELLIAAFLIYTPGVNSAVNLAPLKWESYIPPLPFMLLLIFYDEILRLCIRLSDPRSWMYQEFLT